MHRAPEEKSGEGSDSESGWIQRSWEQHWDAGRAILKTLATTGKAMLFTSLVLSAGFFIFTLSSLINLITFGMLTGFAIVMAFIADITITPALLTLVSRYRTRAAKSDACAERSGARAGDPLKS
jgi:uncharacterized membrane protein YdfJ with MMPL/SSD domain